jgi:hypothetical protein
MKSMYQILSSKNLTGLITSVQGGVPTDILPEAFFSLKEGTTGDYATWHVKQNTRQVARRAEYGAAAPERDNLGLQELPVKLLHAVEKKTYSPTTIMNLMKPGTMQADKMGRAEVARQSEEFARLFLNLRAASVYSFMRSGIIYFDASGNLLPSSTGATFSMDLGVPAGNKGNFGGIFSANWSVATTPIAAQIEALQLDCRKNTGRQLTTAYYGKNVFNTVLKNNDVISLLRSNNMLAYATTNRKLPDGFLGIDKWLPVSGAFFADKNNAATEFFAGDYIGFTPTLDSSLYGIVEGTYPVPKSVGSVASDGATAEDLFEETQGMFSYATVSANPPRIEHVAGDTFLPLPKVPSAFYMGTINGN